MLTRKFPWTSAGSLATFNTFNIHASSFVSIKHSTKTDDVKTVAILISVVKKIILLKFSSNLDLQNKVSNYYFFCNGLGQMWTFS